MLTDVRLIDFLTSARRKLPLEFSLQDNCLLACNESLLHYRTPTEPGSSGSPVFEPEDWRVVALHHKGSEELRRIDGVEGTCEANEGIAILTLQGTGSV